MWFSSACKAKETACGGWRRPASSHSNKAEHISCHAKIPTVTSLPAGHYKLPVTMVSSDSSLSHRPRRRSVSGALCIAAAAALCVQRGSLCSAAAASGSAYAGAAFVVQTPRRQAPVSPPGRPTSLGAWFGGGNAKQQDEKDAKSSDADAGRPYPSSILGGGDDAQDGGEMGRTASTLEAFKAAQEVGKRTAQVMNELSGMTIEGNGPLGVRAYVDGRGRPTGIKMDGSLLGNRGEGDATAAAAVSAEDVQDAITKAFQDAYDKSLEQQEEKMTPLYSDLGLST